MKLSPFTKTRLAASLLLATAAAAIAPSASAFDERRHYSYCVDETATSNMFTGGNNSTTNSLLLACPVTDNASLPHWSITTVHFYNDDKSTSFGVMASRCIEYANISGGSCGTSVSSSAAGTGVNALVVPNTPASFAADWNVVFGHFAYLSAVVPPKSGGNTSRVKGYWVTN